MMYWLLVVAVAISAAVAYLWHANRAITCPPPEALKLAADKWSEKDVHNAYERVEREPTDVRPFLYEKQSRRYVVAGGSGSVGGWIVKHLLMRGEDPEAIRIIDLNAPTRDDLAHLIYIKVDISNPASVTEAFETPWPASVHSLPLTVFHCVAYINPSHRKAMFLNPYTRVNIDGTRNMLASAQKAGATCFVFTSSASVGVRAPSYWPWPWQRWPKDIFQVCDNAEPQALDAPLEAFPACYTWTKAQAELLVREANSDEFRTGSLRPGHAIYGHGVEQSSSVTWNYLHRGGSQTWLQNCIAHFVSNQNVSIAHLAYEHTLLSRGSKAGGKAYCVCDPGPPIFYGELYKVLTLLAHPSTPVKFPEVPHPLVLLMAYVLEIYEVLQVKFGVLPPVKGDFAVLRPAMFNLCTLHLVFSDQRARDEIGYRSPITTLEGFVLAVKDWNDRFETKLERSGVEEAKKMQEVEVNPEKPIAREVA